MLIQQLQTKRPGSRFLWKRNLLLLGDRNMSNGEQPEELDSDPSSDEDVNVVNLLLLNHHDQLPYVVLSIPFFLFQEVPQILKSAIPQRTMADQFHLALGAVSTNERLCIARPKQFG